MALDDCIDRRVGSGASPLGVGNPSDSTGHCLNDDRGWAPHVPAGHNCARSVSLRTIELLPKWIRQV
jgi:hypothetical protein